MIRGGPFYRAQEALLLIDSGRWNLGRRIFVALAVSWAPLLLITLLAKPHAALGLLGDYPVNIRTLVAVPVLLAGQVVMESVFRKIVRHVGDADLLPAAEIPRLDEILLRLIRLRDSTIPEVLIVLAAYVRVMTIVRGDMSHALPWAVTGTGDAVHLSIAGWYYELVSQFICLFLAGISLWKWLLWTVFLFRLSRLDLKLFATHPDKRGGLGFLGMSPTAIAPTLLVASAAIGATWRVEILRTGQHLMDFKIDAIVLLGLVLVLAFGPLVVFVPRLSRLRRQGILEYGALGQMHSEDFHRRWIEHREGHEEEFITAPDSSSLIDFASSFENVEDLKPFPFDKGAFIGVLLAIAIPMLPVILAEIPLAEVLKGLMSALK